MTNTKKACETNVHPELDHGRRLVQRELRRRGIVHGSLGGAARARLRKGPLTYAKLGKLIGDPGSRQLKLFVYGWRTLPLDIAANVALRLFVPLSALLTAEQREVVRLVRLLGTMETLRGRTRGGDTRDAREGAAGPVGRHHGRRSRAGGGRP